MIRQKGRNRIQITELGDEVYPDFDSLTRFQRRSGFPGRCAQGDSGSVALQRKM